jgi:hypothetical protein
MKLRHLVPFGFGKAQSPGATAEIIRRFVELKALVPDIEIFEWGENSSREGLDRGHSHAFLLTFASARARDAIALIPSPNQSQTGASNSSNLSQTPYSMRIHARLP